MVTEVKNQETPDGDQREKPPRKTLAGSAVLYWVVATIVVSGLLCGIPLAVFALVSGGADHRSVLASLIGAAGLVIVALGILNPGVLGRGVVSSAHSVQPSREHSWVLVSTGMSFLVGAAGYWITHSSRVLIASLAAGALVVWLASRAGSKHAA